MSSKISHRMWRLKYEMMRISVCAKQINYSIFITYLSGNGLNNHYLTFLAYKYHQYLSYQGMVLRMEIIIHEYPLLIKKKSLIKRDSSNPYKDMICINDTNKYR